MTKHYSELIPLLFDPELMSFDEENSGDTDAQPSESSIRNILQYAASLFVFQDQDDESQFLIMN
jgi:hypothetical protein